MNDIAHLDRSGLPSRHSLIKATATALVVAVVLLATVVLPAEYGVDPTGVGARLGLKAMSAQAPEEDPATGSAASDVPATEELVLPLAAIWKNSGPYRSDEMSLTLQPGRGAEIKAKMRAGERLVFTWAAEGGVVSFDMHGEEANAKNGEFTSYWIGDTQASAHGAFVAPFDGTHGWYWRNRGSEPVTVRVQTSGFYERLFRP